MSPVDDDAPRDRTGRLYRPVPDTRPEIDLLKVFGWPLGGYLIVWGLVALARAGFERFDFFNPQVQVGMFHGTRLMALIVLAIGIVIWAGVVGAPDDLGLRVLGAFMLVAGIVFLIEANSFNRWLGIQTVDGYHVGVPGLVLIVTSLIQPFRVGRKKTPRASEE